jgi:hypothetical protein
MSSVVQGSRTTLSIALTCLPPPPLLLQLRGFGAISHLADDTLMFAGERVETSRQLAVSLLPLATFPSAASVGPLPAALIASPTALVLDCGGAARKAVRYLGDIAAVLSHAAAQVRSLMSVRPVPPL